MLSLNLGPRTTAPLASVGVSINYGDFFTVNISEGSNIIPLSSASTESKEKDPLSVIRINVEGWQNNRINLESLTINPVCPSLPSPPQSYLIFLGCDFASLHSIQACFSVYRRLTFSGKHDRRCTFRVGV